MPFSIILTVYDQRQQIPHVDFSALQLMKDLLKVKFVFFKCFFLNFGLLLWQEDWLKEIESAIRIL
jgi:hypothetical protein